MNRRTIKLYQRTYTLPVLAGGELDNLQRTIQSRSQDLRRGYRVVEKITEEKSGWFGKKQVRQQVRQPLTFEERYVELDNLVKNYDCIIETLTTHQEEYQQFFYGLAEEIQTIVTTRCAAVATLEAERRSLEDLARTNHDDNLLQVTASQKDQLLQTARTVGLAAILMLKKLELMRQSLEKIANDKETQRRVLAEMVQKLGLQRQAYELQLKINRLQAEAAEMAKVALNFEEYMAQFLGSFQTLLANVSQVDGEMAGAVKQIQEIANLMLNDQPQNLPQGDRSSEQVLDFLLAGQVPKDRLLDALERSREVNSEVAFDLEVEAIAPGEVSLEGCLENIQTYVSFQLAPALQEAQKMEVKKKEECRQAAEACLKSGNAKFNLGDNQGAIADLTEAIRLQPDDADAYNGRGNAKSSLGDFQGAIADYTEAIRLQPDDAYAYYSRGFAKVNLGDNQGAIADLTEVIRLKPDYADAYNNRGKVKLFDSEDYQGAIADYTEAIRLQPDHAYAYNNRGDAKFELGDYQGAIADYTEAIRLQPDHAYAYHNRGLAKSNLGDYQGAIADYNEAIRLKPDYADAYNNRGLAKSNLGDYQGAIADYNEAIRLKPDYADAYNNRGNAKFNLGDYQGAIIDYDESIRLNNPELYLPYNNRGLAKSNLGDYQGAIADYTEAIRLKPDYADAYNNRGFAKSNLGDYQGAIADYTEAIRLKPDYADAYNNRGFAKSNLGDYQGAIADYTEAIRLQPDHAYAYNNRENAKSNLGDYQGAIADYNEAIRLKPDSADAYFKRGNAKYNSGDNQGAIANYNEAIRLQPDHADAYNNRGNAKFNLGDYQGAMADFGKAAELYQKQGNTQKQRFLRQHRHSRRESP